MKKETINVSWWIARSAHSLAAMVFMIGVVAAVLLAGLFGFSKLDTDFLTDEMSASVFSWLITAGISAAVALVVYLVLNPFIPSLRVLSRRDIIDLEKSFPARAYTQVLRFYTEVGTINQLTVNKLRRNSEEDDLEVLRQRYLGASQE
ncbi:hypothetical protein [Marinobacterium mangrovicola]|uniref:Uncharacterized protein n=1 Tax=Marinobacterium mangrovicola TaxID=1476959 RepID=A0A4R1GSS8_9GAMM|nr:hypothetical protein [Marinobacterium mangrovicola]TCK09289.1 hypothetical protein CLV83_1395 [Marinobacterium mangrovicola]